VCAAQACSPHRRRNRRRCGDGVGCCCCIAGAHDRAPAPRDALGSVAPPRKPATCATYRSACGHAGGGADRGGRKRHTVARLGMQTRPRPPASPLTTAMPVVLSMLPWSSSVAEEAGGKQKKRGRGPHLVSHILIKSGHIMSRASARAVMMLSVMGAAAAFTIPLSARSVPTPAPCLRARVTPGGTDESTPKTPGRRAPASRLVAQCGRLPTLSLARAPRTPAWAMQADSGNGKQDAEDLEEKLKELGSTTKSRLDAAIENPEVAKEMAKSAAQKRIDELKAIAREPPKPRAQVLYWSI